MKTIVLVLATLVTANFAFASANLKCAKIAEKEAAKYAEMSLKEFRQNMSLIWACKYKQDPSIEEIQFGDGSSLTGVSLKIINGKCTVTDIYSGQDDQDGDASSDKANCL
ncbi:hypothetical protein [Bdellovibrio sp. BCCA]|uniref:hypothetical protein n=1 Tax=Bdellovibrio sp. BCCA TaxID=3136281 RepID=UPI0030F1B9BB